MIRLYEGYSRGNLGGGLYSGGSRGTHDFRSLETRASVSLMLSLYVWLILYLCSCSGLLFVMVGGGDLQSVYIVWGVLLLGQVWIHGLADRLYLPEEARLRPP